jgi:hypothetical protein
MTLNRMPFASESEFADDLQIQMQRGTSLPPLGVGNLWPSGVFRLFH